MLYTVGEVAKKFNIATSTLRYYDKEGLLPFLERSGGGARMFSDDDMDWLQLIECLKKTGMPLKDIKHFIDYCIEGDPRIDERLSIIENQRNAVIQKMNEMQDMLDMLSYKCWYYEKAKAAGTCSVHNHLSPEDVPERFQRFLKK